MMEAIKYDKLGRMKYNPEFHPNMGKAWSTDDLYYLINWYDKIGADEMSFALGRTIDSVMERARVLKKQGLMPQVKHVRHKRTYNEAL